ncbi:MAG: hypothetical protein H7301_04185 [Cryobacterium sp.]|nr:hypothetical protein [Oligoflexia bacterium]
MSSPAARPKKSFIRKIILTISALLALVVSLVAAAVLIIWFRPEWILTPARVSKLAAFALVEVKDPKHSRRENLLLPPGDPALLPVTLHIDRPNLKQRTFHLGLGATCYAMKDSLVPGISFCVEEAQVALTIELFKTTGILPTVKLVALNNLNIVLSTLEMKPQPDQKEKKPTVEPSSPTWMKFVAENFRWGPVHLEAKEFRIGADGMIIRAKFTNLEGGSENPVVNGELNSPTLDFNIGVEAKGYRVTSEGKIEEDGNLIRVPSATAIYTSVPEKGIHTQPMKISADYDATYDLKKSEIKANFSARWKNPNKLISDLKADKSTFKMDPHGMAGKTNLAVTLKGKTPAGTLPVLNVALAAEMKNATSGNPPVVDLKLDLNSYTFAGIHAKSDLEVRITPRGEKTDLELKRGELRIEVREFHDTIKALERTSWAIPAPFAVLRGPIVLKTSPFQQHKDSVEIPLVLNSDLRSREQAVKLETKAVVTLSNKTLAPVKTSIDVVLEKIKLRLPDYDPLAPVPAYASDPRIIRYEEVKKKQVKAAKKAEKIRVAKENGEAPPMPISVNITGAPGSLTLLNRYFEPAFSSAVNFKMVVDATNSSPTGDVVLSEPFDIHYLNREVTVERLRLALNPLVTFSCFVSMKRSGYKITAEVIQELGKTRIKLGSVPALENNEIVSLLIYGMPMNSISSEQQQSAGNAETAMSSDALGVFSFFAFASTPIESVRYDSATQTYSAVVSLPGGLVASIGSSWDNDRQVSISKSLGKNWAVSTEIIKDSDGVGRGGTLLRWRKSY